MNVQNSAQHVSLLSINLWCDTVADKVTQEFLVMKCKHVFNQTQHVDWRVWKVLEPVLAPACYSQSTITIIIISLKSLLSPSTAADLWYLTAMSTDNAMTQQSHFTRRHICCLDWRHSAQPQKSCFKKYKTESVFLCSLCTATVLSRFARNSASHVASL